MRRNHYSPEFREQALLKARQRGQRTLASVADELNLSLGTLKNWLKQASHPAIAVELTGAASSYTSAQQLKALMESYTFTGPALAAWCRERGLFEHQLQQWHDAFCLPAAATTKAEQAELRVLQQEKTALQRELRRKESALAEAAALLVLQKKFQALWVDEVK
jgi:transposase